MDKTMVHEQKYTKRGQLVIPLDCPRTMETRTVALISGTTKVNIAMCSGKIGYLQEMLACEYSGVDAKIQLLDKAGSGLCPYIPVEANTCVCWKPCPCPAGPICSGVDILPTLSGEVTLLLQIDPQVIE